MWAQSVQHPSAGITKEYIVTCSAEPTRRQLETIASGCEVDGAYVTPVAVAPVKDIGQKDRLRIVVAEGRNREVLNPSCAQLSFSNIAEVLSCPQMRQKLQLSPF